MIGPDLGGPRTCEASLSDRAVPASGA